MVLVETQVIITLVIVSILSFIVSSLLIRYKKLIGILDIPNERSSHTYIVPRSGGIAIFIAFTVGTLIVNLHHSYDFIFPLMGVFLMGLADDVKPVPSKIKLLWIAFMAMILYLFGFDIQHIGIFFNHDIVFPYGVALLFFVFAVSGFVSALNLIDGLDGLASVVSLAILLPFAYMGYKYEDIFLMYTSLLLMSSISGFLLLNWHPAKIFMGDSGSMFLGFMIAIVVVYAIQKDYITAVSTLFLAGVPILDTLIVMFRRILQHRSPLNADRTHMHHIILKYQYGNTRKTVLIIGLLQGLFSYIGLGFKVRDDFYILLLYILLFIIFYLLLTPKRA